MVLQLVLVLSPLASTPLWPWKPTAKQIWQLWSSAVNCLTTAAWNGLASWSQNILKKHQRLVYFYWFWTNFLSFYFHDFSSSWAPVMLDFSFGWWSWWGIWSHTFLGLYKTLHMHRKDLRRPGILTSGWLWGFLFPVKNKVESQTVWQIIEGMPQQYKKGLYTISKCNFFQQWKT